MNQEEKIKEIQEKIDKLSVDVNSSFHQIRLLQAALDDLRWVNAKEKNEKRVGIQNKMYKFIHLLLFRSQ